MKQTLNHQLVKRVFTPKQMVVLYTWFHLPAPKVTQTKDGYKSKVSSSDVEEEMGIEERGSTSVTTTDVAVARILLSPVAKRLPQWASVDIDKHEVYLERDNSWTDVRVVKPIVALISRRILTVDWSQTPVGAGPEEYRATWVPGFDKVVITGSTDSEELYGHTDFALGYCEPGETLVTDIGKILKDWWLEQRQEWDQAPWSLIDAGIIDECTANRLRDEAWSDDSEESEGD